MGIKFTNLLSIWSKNVLLVGASVLSSLQMNSQSGSMLNFGASQRVILGTSISNSLSTSNKITVEAWVRPNGTGNLGCIVTNYGTGGSNMQFLMRQDYTNFTFWIGSGSSGPFSQAAAANATVGAWTHLAGVWDGTVATLYVNGVLSGSSTITYTSLGVHNQAVFIGGNNINENFDGSIDEVRIWNRDLCLNEIINNKDAELSLPQFGLLAYHKFNQGIAGANNFSETSSIDASGFNNNGSLQNFALSGVVSNWGGPSTITTGSAAPYFNGGIVSANSGTVISGGNFAITPNVGPGFTITSQFGGTVNAVVNPTTTSSYFVTGMTGACLNSAAGTVSVQADHLNFDGVNDFVTIPNMIGNDFTIEYWVKTLQVGGGPQWFNGRGILDAEVTGVTNDFGTALVGNKFAFGMGNPDITLISTTNINDGAWHHVAATRVMSTGSIALYVDGNLEASSVASNLIANASANIRIGSMNTLNNFFNGSVDEIRIWNRALCGSEISNNMVGQLSLPQNGLVAYYKLNQGFTGNNNGSENIVIDSAPLSYTGAISNMALNGSTSNWSSTGGFNWGTFAPLFTQPGFTVSATSNTICTGSSLTINASGANSYTWSTGANTTSISVSPTVTTNYSVSGSFTNGCLASKFYTVSVFPTIPSMNISGPALICINNSATLTSSGAVTYTWNTGANTASIVVSPTTNTSYTAQGTGVCGGVGTSTFNLIVSLCTAVEKIESEERKFTVYPNPSSGIFNISADVETSFEVYDALGNRILNENLHEGNYTLNLGDRSRGIYFIKASVNDHVRVLKIVKD